VLYALVQSERKRVVSRRLKLSMLSAGSLKSSLGEVPGPGQQQRMPDVGPTCWDCVAARPDDDVWRDDISVDSGSMKEIQRINHSRGLIRGSFAVYSHSPDMAGCCFVVGLLVRTLIALQHPKHPIMFKYGLVALQCGYRAEHWTLNTWYQSVSWTSRPCKPLSIYGPWGTYWFVLCCHSVCGLE